jgi:hypothetical protein
MRHYATHPPTQGQKTLRQILVARIPMWPYYVSQTSNVEDAKEKGRITAP